MNIIIRIMIIRPAWRAPSRGRRDLAARPPAEGTPSPFGPWHIICANDLTHNKTVQAVERYFNMCVISIGDDSWNMQ